MRLRLLKWTPNAQQYRSPQQNAISKGDMRIDGDQAKL
jgi:hypothetical protein